jgi:hypothetical protein
MYDSEHVGGPEMCNSKAPAPYSVSTLDSDTPVLIEAHEYSQMPKTVERQHVAAVEFVVVTLGGHSPAQ